MSSAYRSPGHGGTSKQLIIIPAYNEEESLPGVIRELDQLPSGFEILIINDGSTDRTGELAHALTARCRHALHVVDLPVNLGIGVAVQTGYQFAVASGEYDYIIQFDADGQHMGEFVPALVDACRHRQLDLCIGSRFAQCDARLRGDTSTPARRAGIRFLAFCIRCLAGTRVTDPTSGFRCAGPRVWRAFANRYPDDFPEPESLLWCLRHRLCVGELPVLMRSRRGGISSIRAWTPAYYMLKVTLAMLVDTLRPNEASNR